MTTLTVGPGMQFTTVAGAIAASHDGDVLQVQAGVYTNDFAEITTKITLQGVGGTVQMVATVPIPGDKGILVTDTDVTISNFEFSGATGPSGNDAGIRYQGGDLTLVNDYFHNNQNGLLSNASTGAITILNSEFSNNGAGDGYTHDIYVGDIAQLTIANSYFHDANVGHEIKSRAELTVITNSRIFDNNSTASYSIDLPNGGRAIIENNIIQQGSNSQNSNIVAYGEEGNLHLNSSLTLDNNTVINDLLQSPMLLLDASGSPATMTNTNVYGLTSSQLASSTAVTISGTNYLGSEPALDLSHPAASTTPAPNGSGAFDGGAANDALSGGAGDDFIRGLNGDDLVLGGDGSDTINGNQGDDSVNGGAGNDVVYGGQGVDVVDGGAGADVVNGNLGEDVVHGGDGDDTVYGGQGNDVVFGDAGDDRISGDLGDDILWGGSGADTFVGSPNGGIDVIADFNPTEGDKIALPTGTTYTLTTLYGVEVIDLGGGNEIGLATIPGGTFSANWIVYT